MKVLFSILYITLSSVCLVAQEIYNSEEEFLIQYNKDIKQSHLDGVYIPATLDEAFEDLVKLSENEAIEKFAAADIDKAAPRLHFGLGRWMAVNWKFHTGSRLSHLLKGKGLIAPDAMIQYMLYAFHAHLNGQALTETKVIENANAKHVADVKKTQQGDKVLKQTITKKQKPGDN